MRYLNVFLFFIFLASLSISADSVDYDHYFTKLTLRIDFYHGGDKELEFISIDRLYKQGEWAGSRSHLLDSFDRGRYAIKVHDIKTGALVFSKGYDSYFGEYKTTDEAIAGIPRTYKETVLMPFPRDSVRFELYLRDKQQNLNLIFTQKLDPNAVSVVEHAVPAGVRVVKAIENGIPQEKVDLAIIGDGYTTEEAKKFEEDVMRFADMLLNKEPFKKHRSRFNIFGVLKPSSESGCDEPTKGIYRNTSVSSTFNSLSSPRYLLTEDIFAMHDIAAAVPADFFVIMVNSKRYGGGGIYNFFATCTSDNEWTDFVFVHEFGHLFAGLADEYYSSSIAYNDFYPEGIEPLEPNITRLLHEENVKWENLMEANTPVPTPWEKSKYDSISAAYSKSRQLLNEEIANAAKIDASQAVRDSLQKEYNQLAKTFAEQSNDILYNNEYSNKVGVFEGGGYISEGMYRPMLDCIMFRIGRQEFCKVCQSAIEETIEFYSE